MFADVWTIIGKELTRVFTDKKLVFTTFVLPALSLVVIYMAMGIMVQNMVSDREAHVATAMVINQPQSLSTYLAAHPAENIVFKPAAEAELDALKQQIYEGKLDALVVFGTDFDQAIGQYQNQQVQRPNVLTFYNPTEDYSSAAHGKLSDVLKSYERDLLIQRFGSEDFLKAFTVDLNNNDTRLAPPEKVSGDFLGGLVPMLLSIFLFSGGMGIGIDLITGEKERGTMATMLVTPIKREAIAFGKMLSLAIISLVSTASSLFGMVIAFPFLMKAFNAGEEPSSGGGIGPMTLSIEGIGQFVILAILLTLIYVGIICIISVYANSIKEAGTTITPAYMVIMLMGIASLFGNGIPQLWVFATPVYGTLLGMKHALSAELTWTMFGVNFLSSLVVIALIIWGIKKMFNSEKVMFGA